MRRRRMLQQMREIDVKWILSRNERSGNRSECHDHDNRNAEARAVVAEQTTSLRFIEHSIVESGVAELRRRVFRLSTPAPVLPEILFRNFSYPFFEKLREANDDCIDVFLPIAGERHFDRLDDHAIFSVRQPYSVDKEYGSIE